MKNFYTRRLKSSMARKLVLPSFLCFSFFCSLSAQEPVLNYQESLSRVAYPKHKVLYFSEKGQNGFVLGNAFRKEGDKAPYGIERVVMEEDFSKMQGGTEQVPDKNVKITLDEAEYPWWNLNPIYTKLPHWGAGEAYPAGGKIALTKDFAHINTPLLDLSKHSKYAVLRFKARLNKKANEKLPTILLVEAAETNNMSPSWRMLGNVAFNDLSEDWKLYEVPYLDCGPSTMFNIVKQVANPEKLDVQVDWDIILDDIQVLQYDMYVDIPELLPYTSYKGDSFDIHWTKAKNASAYLINVFTLNEKKERVYLLQDKEVGDVNSFHVEGVKNGEVYLYTVRGVKKDGDKTYISPESLPKDIFALTPPSMKETKQLEEGIYEASWNATPSAERYNFLAYRKREAKKDEAFVLTNEAFDSLLLPDGNSPSYSIDDPQSYTFDQYALKGTKQEGWIAKNGYPYTSCICVDGYQYIYNRQDAGLISPEFDLSKDGGKVKLDFKVYGTYKKGENEDGSEYEYQVGCVVALFNYNEIKGQYEQVELVRLKDVKPEWKSYTVELSKGSKKSKIGIYAVTAPDNLYIDDLKITQNYKKGDTFMDPFLFFKWLEGTKCSVEVPQEYWGENLYHRVSATKSRQGSNPYGGPQRADSDYSDYQEVPKQLISKSLDVNSGAKASVYTMNGTVHIQNPKKENITIFASDGMLIKSIENVEQTIVKLNPGIYFVRVANRSFKVIL